MPFIQQFDTTMNLLQKVLDLRARNQQVISSNIANAETPGYSAASFKFEDQLKSAMLGGNLSPVATNKNHIGVTPANIEQIQGEIVRHKDKTGIGDQNSVSVDQEMVKLSENEILYEAAIAMLNKKLSILKYAANDGR
jgi:flagellar basal-body rod protein FlgB